MKRLMKMRWLLIAAAALAVVAAACGSSDDPTATPANTAVPATNTPAASATPTSQEPKEFKLVSGWYRDQQVKYYDFGANSPSTGGAVSVAPIWAFITGMDANGDPVFVEGQHNIVDAVPGDTGYSDLWQVNLVTVPGGYVADTIKSYDDLVASGYSITPTTIFVNCPIVPEGSTLESGKELVQGWYKGEEVFYPDYGPNPATAIPIYALVTGFDSAGAPQFVEGQSNIIDSVPGQTGYSAFWEVNLVTVPSGYVANTLKSAADVLASGYEIVKPGIVVNCPVVESPDPFTVGEAKEFDLVNGWYRDRQVQYYDFGSNSPSTGGAVSAAPIWAFITGMDANGDPVFVEDQKNIVNVVPGDAGYSDLWQVNLVTVPEGYVANSVRSYDDLVAAGYTITPTSIFVNCPIVPEGSTLEGGKELTQGWYKGNEVYYPDFGMNPATAIPIWAFITGFDASGNPQFVEGQSNIIDSIPGDDGYSAFWEVNLVTVPSGYVANTLKSAADVLASGYETVQPGIVVNCPVIEYPGA
jgi:hypothetical protein